MLSLTNADLTHAQTEIPTNTQYVNNIYFPQILPEISYNFTDTNIHYPVRDHSIII